MKLFPDKVAAVRRRRRRRHGSRRHSSRLVEKTSIMLSSYGLAVKRDSNALGLRALESRLTARHDGGYLKKCGNSYERGISSKTVLVGVLFRVGERV